MFPEKQLRTDLVSLDISPEPIFLPVRKQVALNIAAQIEDGISFEMTTVNLETLDRLLNYSLKPEYRAPSTGQIKLVGVIASELEIEVDEDVYKLKSETERFIAKYHPTLEAIRDQKMQDEE